MKQVSTLLILFLQCVLSAHDALQISASIFSGVPDSNINEHVSTTTGEYYIAEADIIAPGIEPLSITRVYLSEGSAFNREKWTILPHLTLQEEKNLQDYLSTHDPYGAPLLFISTPNTPDFHFYLEPMRRTITNTGSGIISGQTNTKNHKAYRFSQRHIEITTPTGGKRQYRRKDTSGSQYFLTEEQLPNGNIIIYQYTESSQIQNITSYNHSKTKKYAEFTFDYDEKRQTVRIKSHTGDWVQYFYFKARDENKVEHRCFCSFESNTSQTEKIDFDLQNGWKKFTVTKRQYEDNYAQTIRYYRPTGEYNVHGHGYFKLKENDPRTGRVESVGIDPIGNGSTEFLYQVLYHIPDSHKKQYIHDPATEIVYATLARENYSYSKDLRLKKKTRFNRDKKQIYATDYYWKEEYPNIGNLLRQDESGFGCIYLSKEYTYNRGNDLILEKTTGDLTGEGTATHEVAYDIIDDERHLIQKKTFSDGKIEYYTYLDGTNLIQSRIITSSDSPIQRRAFYTYDEDNLLIEQIEDDAPSQDKEILLGATYRKRTLITRRQEEPAIGYPEEIQEYGYDFETGVEKLILRKYIHYDRKSQVLGIDIHDAEGIYRYSYFFAYDKAGRCTIETDPLMRETIRTYGKNGLLLSEKKGNSFQTQIKNYDNAHRLISETITTPDGLSKTQSFEYNILSHLTAETDPLGNEIIHTRDEHGYLLKTETNGLDSIPASITYTNDYAGRPTTIIDEEGRKSTFAYTGLGKTKKEHPSAAPLNTKTYYPNGLLKEIQEPAKATTYTYDHFERITSETIAQENHRANARINTKTYSGYHLLSETDFTGKTTTYTYDYAGRIKTKKTNTTTTTFDYDSLGNCINEKIYLQTLLISEHQFSFDLAGRKTEETHLNGKGETLLHQTFIYDDADNLIAETTNNSLQTWEYDGYGRLLKHTDRSGATTRHEYTDGVPYRGLKCLFKKTYTPTGAIIEETFHPKGKLLLKQIKNPRVKTTYTENYTYNKAGDLLQITYDGPYPVTISYGYDIRGRLVALEEHNGTRLTTTTMLYDSSNNLVETKKPDGVYIYRSYDCFGQERDVGSSDQTIGYVKTYSKEGHLLTAFSDITGKTTCRQYDTNGNLIQDTFEHGYTITHRFDDLGRKKQTKHPDGKTITYQYRGDQLKQIALLQNDTKQILHTYDAYDEEGSLLQETRGDGSIAHYTYDSSGRPLAITSTTYNETIDEYSSSGNILSHTLSETSTYTYDHLDQITSENDTSYTFSTFHQLEKKNATQTTTSGTQITRYQDITYEYDLCGRRSKKTTPSGITTYTYDAFDRLITITTPNTTIHYTYDILNRLITEATPETTTHYIYDETLEIGALDETLALQQLRVLGLGQGGATGSAIALFIQDAYYIPICDIIGNIRAIYAPDQTLLEEYAPTIFGENLPSDPLSPWIYQSKRHNPETNLIYFGDRFYDPLIIAWISPDPLRLNSQPNLYQFLRNNPFKYLDEYGDEDINVYPFVPLDQSRDYNHVPRSSPLYCPHENYLNPQYQSRITSLQALEPNIKYRNGWEGDHKKMIVYANGINNSFEDAVGTAKYISELSGGHNVHIIYNQTHNIIFNLMKCNMNMKGEPTKPVFLIMEFFKMCHSQANGNPYDALLITHSQAGALAFVALGWLSRDIQEHISALNVAGAKPIPENFTKSSINLRAGLDRDLVPYLHHMYKRGHPNPDLAGVRLKANIRTLKSHPNAPLMDHSIHSPTYTNEIEYYSNKFIKTGSLQ